MKHIPVFYSPKMVAAANVSASPSAGKPKQAVNAWQVAKLPISLRDFSKVTKDDLNLVHDRAYIDGILDGTIPNGFGNQMASVARSLPYTTGAMLAAARHARSAGVACAPVSGFHHARWNEPSGFCTFNGLMVTAMKLRVEKLVDRVLILDLDMHFGDGTEQIIQLLGAQEVIHNVTFGRWYQTPEHAGAYMHGVRDVVKTFGDYDMILYQAGADVHVDDPYGGVLSSTEMRERDHRVFEAAHRWKTPIAWNLAGGYQNPINKVLALHTATMEECVKVFCG